MNKEARHLYAIMNICFPWHEMAGRFYAYVYLFHNPYFYEELYYFTSPPTLYENSSSSTSLPTFDMTIIFTFVHANRCAGVTRLFLISFCQWLMMFRSFS